MHVPLGMILMAEEEEPTRSCNSDAFEAIHRLPHTMHVGHIFCMIDICIILAYR